MTATGTPLFIAEPVGTCRLVLRRFRYGQDAGDHGHDASVVIAEEAAETAPNADGTRSVTDDRIPHDDPRWPARCDCGEIFTADDRRQVNEIPWYEGGGHRFAWGIGSWDGPAGALIRAPWRDQEGRPAAWIVFLPNGTTWCTDDRASGGQRTELGPYWNVTGTAPDLTVSPSIWDQTPGNGWHGWIRAGHLVDA